MRGMPKECESSCKREFFEICFFESILETLLYRDKEVEIKFVSLVLAYISCLDF